MAGGHAKTVSRIGTTLRKISARLTQHLTMMQKVKGLQADRRWHVYTPDESPDAKYLVEQLAKADEVLKSSVYHPPMGRKFALRVTLITPMRLAGCSRPLAVKSQRSFTARSAQCG